MVQSQGVQLWRWGKGKEIPIFFHCFYELECKTDQSIPHPYDWRVVTFTRDVRQKNKNQLAGSYLICIYGMLHIV